ncbi:MAG: carbohydrate kinase family protein, partial [Anaerolineae bacterium]|nr:carbohydrate kinase family protein [Anaerolineae bacterium]
MTDKLDFIGVGGLAYDLLLKVDQLPLTDNKYPAEVLGRVPGGFIANATCAAARLDLQTGYVGWAGDDAEGAMLYKDFVKWNVQPVGLARVRGRATPFAIVVTDRTGKRAILLPSFPLYHAELTIEQLTIVARGRVVYTFPRDAIWCGQLRRAVLDSGGLFALDVETANPMRGDDLRDVAQLADILFVTAESIKLLGVKSIKSLCTGKQQWVIMTDGEKGAQGITGSMKKLYKQPAYKVT